LFFQTKTFVKVLNNTYH